MNTPADKAKSKSKSPRIVVLSGGSGGNALVEPLATLTDAVTYILPVSDNGGSTSEILRVLGSVSVGDLRSRLVRLIPDLDPQTGEANATKALLAYRLPADSAEARTAWLEILDGRHGLWQPVQIDVRRSLAAYLRVFHTEVLQRTAGLARGFDFSTAAVGNLVLAGMVLFLGHVETAVFTFRKLTGIAEATRVLPILSTRFTTPIAARLQDGTVIAGQNAISHPTAYSALTPTPDEAALSSDEDDDAHPPGSLASLRAPGIVFDKATHVPLSSSIAQIYYINPYGQAMHPHANPRALSELQSCDALVYAPGSLYTSLAPLLLPIGMAQALRRLQAAKRPRIFLLNGTLDRETPGYSAVDFLKAAAQAAGLLDATPLTDGGAAEAIQTLCSHLVHIQTGDDASSSTPETRAPSVDDALLRHYGVVPVPCAGYVQTGGGRIYDKDALARRLTTLVAAPAQGLPMRRSTVVHVAAV